MDIMPEHCSYTNCTAPLSQRLRVLLCDRHAIKAYREVRSEMDRAQAAKKPLPVVPASTVRPSRARPGKPVGVVYFVRFGERIKIGFSTDLRARMQVVPHDEILATMAGTMEDEKRLHAQFAAIRIHHEWFHATPELLEFIDDIKRAA